MLEKREKQNATSGTALCHCQILRGDLYNDRDRRIIKMPKP